ncbi:MAG: S-layer homology domain-containing protein [Candidatus Margulisiibacteriota bacterium]
MKRALVLILALCLMSCPVSAAAKSIKGKKAEKPSIEEFRFRDVPDTHWAAKAVYRLVKMGVTQGYPDGTFRGNKNITRFETALFLSKLADSTGAAGMEKLSAELRSELKELKAEMEERNPYRLSGYYETKMFIGNVLANNNTGAPHGPVINYRVKTALESSPRPDSSLKINLDTMDAGYYGGYQDIATKLFDIEGVLKMDAPIPMVFKATSGPGPQQHLYNSPVMPSEYGITYVRPYNSLGVSAKVYGSDLGFSYTAHNVSTNDAVTPGQVGAGQYTGSLAWDTKLPVINRTRVTLSGDYFVKDNTAGQLASFMPKIELASDPSEKVKFSATVAGGAFRSFTHSNLMLKAGLALLDHFNSGTTADIQLFLVGGRYLTEPQQLDQWSLIGYDPFDRPRVNGARAIQAKITQRLADSLSLGFKGNIDLSSDYMYGPGHLNSRMTYEAGLNMGDPEGSVATISYRLDMDPNSATPNTDLLMFGLSSSF